VRLTFWALNRNVRLDQDAIDRLRTIFATVCEKFESELESVEGNGDDEIRLVVSYPPKHSVASLVNSLKGVSSRLLRAERLEIRQQSVEDSLWSPSYRAESLRARS
jgi:putative transposase